MTASIPASQLVNVVPSVLGTGGNPLSLNAVFLTPDTSIPIGLVVPFANLQGVINQFGASSVEAKRAAIYFNGFSGANAVPGTLYFAQYNTAAVSGYLRGGSVAGQPLSAITALSGVLELNINGTNATSATINLSAATSFSNAASLIQSGFTGGAISVSYDSQRGAFLFTSPTTGAASAVTLVTAGTTGNLAVGIMITAATGGVASPGAAAAVPATLMTTISNQTQNWFTFTTIAEPADSLKLQFDAWVQTQGDTYAYVASDSNVAALSAAASSSFGAIVAATNSDGVVVNYDTTGGDISAFICGAVAAIDFNETNGRITFAYKTQPGLVPQIFDATQALNLEGNCYNFYGQYATPNQAFQFYQPGQVAGQWKWFDEYVNHRLINSNLQLALVSLLATVKAVPYANQGYNLIQAACNGTIQTALAFGAIVPGVSLSPAQAAEVNQAAGLKIDGILSTQGYYLQILDPGAVVRGQRGTPKCTLWYMSGGAVQKITLASIDVL